MALVSKVIATKNGSELVRFDHTVSKTVAGRNLSSVIRFHMFCGTGEFQQGEEFEEFSELLSVCKIQERDYSYVNDDGEEIKITINQLTLKV